MQKYMILIIIMALNLSCTSIGEYDSKTLPLIYIGQWGFDSKTFEKAPELKTIEKDTPTFHFLEETFKSMSVIITKSNFTVTINDSRSFAYKITNITENEVTIENKDEGPSEGNYILKVIDQNHIIMVNIFDPKRPRATYLIRVTS